MSLSRPNKHLRYSEEHFEGYWAQLIALIRHNDEADLVLDSVLKCPLLQLTSEALTEELQEAFEDCTTTTSVCFLQKPESKKIQLE